MKKGVFLIFTLAGFLIVGSLAAVIYSPVFAKSQQNRAQSAAAAMAKYSATKKQHSTTVRMSRLKQMNIVGEAATVLNVLPITIIDEMEKGKTLVQIAQEKGLTEKEFTQKLTDYENKTINTAVRSGTIPQIQANAINQGRSQRLTNGLKEKAVSVKDHAAMDMGN